MYVNRSPGLGSFFTQVRNMAENAVATYYPALRPLVAKPEVAAPPPAPVPTPEAVSAQEKREAGGGLSTPLLIAGGVGLAGLAAFFLLKKKGRK